ncbi:MAG: hypothetical protein EOP84_34460, partial [Verrucomicrobiaceae bacterium]
MTRYQSSIFFRTLLLPLWLLCSQLSSALVNEPVPTASHSGDPYCWTGMILNGQYRGSGSVIRHPKIVVSCAHVVHDESDWISASSCTWSRAFSGSTPPASSQRMPLSGYYSFQGYQSTRANFGVTHPSTFNLDLVTFWAYENTAGGGYGGSVLDGITAIRSSIPKMFTGYPAYPNDPSHTGPARYAMWKAGPFSSRYVAASGRYHLNDSAAAYGGVSGGPLWVQTGGGWYQAG